MLETCISRLKRSSSLGGVIAVSALRRAEREGIGREEPMERFMGRLLLMWFDYVRERGKPELNLVTLAQPARCDAADAH